MIKGTSEPQPGTRRLGQTARSAAWLALAIALGFVGGTQWGRFAAGGSNRGPDQLSQPTPTPRRAIDHVVIVIKENHSYDNYFASRENLPGPPLPHCASRVTQDHCQYVEADLPAYYRYLAAFGSGDRYFVDVDGPSWPNQMMMIAAQSPLDHNPTVLSGPQWGCPFTCYDFPTIGDALGTAGLSWRNYGEAVFDPFRAIRHLASDDRHNPPTSQFFEDLATHQLPAVSWVRPSYPESEHPGYDVREGQWWTVNIVNAVMRSPYWPTTVILVVWDDAGTAGDHVVPPVLEREPGGKPFRYGLRAPFLVVSPYTPEGFVSHRVLSHVSTLKFIETLFHLPPLTQRDADANGLEDFFDLSRPARPPLLLSPDCGQPTCP